MPFWTGIGNARILHRTQEANRFHARKNPLDRFPTYDDFIMALAAARSKLLVSTYGGSGGAKPKWWNR